MLRTYLPDKDEILYVDRVETSKFVRNKTNRWCFYKVNHFKGEDFLYQGQLFHEDWIKLRNRCQDIQVVEDGQSILIRGYVDQRMREFHAIK